MKIIKYSKKDNSMYKVLLEDKTSILLHEDVILKNNLLIKKEIDDIDSLLKESHDYEINNVSLKYISKKMRSKKELFDYLKKEEYPIELINKTLKHLEEQGYLDDFRYAKSYINDRYNLSNDGPKKIIKYLESNNIEENIYIDYLNEVFNQENMYERINKYINKQLKSNKKSMYIFKNKILITLDSLGYYKEDINNCLNNLNESDNEEVYLKAKEKIEKQLSRKYSGIELERKIKERLYREGFYK